MTYRIGPKRCPKCGGQEPDVEFGVDHARTDLKNILCKVCVRERTADWRTERSGKSVERVGEPSTAPDKTFIDPLLPDAEMVLVALSGGPMTQKQITSRTGLAMDKVGEALAELMLDRKEVVRMNRGDQNVYSLVRKKDKAA